MFESVNEPRFTEGGTTNATTGYRLLDTLNTSFHHIVRSSGGNNDTRPLVLPTMHTSSAQPDLDALSRTIQSWMILIHRYRTLLRVLAFQREHRGFHQI